MIARWRWALAQLTKRLWFRASLFSLLGIAAALIAIFFKDFVPPSLPARIGADAVDDILGIIASSMLAVTTFSLSTMVSAYSAASSGVTPRATTLIMEDTTTQNALATFLGSFLFSLVGIIALNTGVYGAQGRVVLFAATIAVLVLIVHTLLRWIDHLSKLGRVGETIDRVEQAAIKALDGRTEWPFLGGAEYPKGFTPPDSACAVLSTETGYVQHIDVQALGTLAKDYRLELYLEVLPGSFVHEGMLLAQIVALSTSEGNDARTVAEKVLATITIGVRRTFEHDPRFGLSVLSEIASRALSPAVNDPGTAIDVIGRGVRCFARCATHATSVGHTNPDCSQVHLRGLEIDDMFDDFFAPIARDGAGLIEVDIRMMKALLSLSEIHPQLFKGICSTHARLLLERAETALTLNEEKTRLRYVSALLAAAGSGAAAQ